MAWTRTIAEMVPKGQRPFVYFLLIAVAAMATTIAVLAKQINADHKIEATRCCDQAERERREKAECELSAILHARDDRRKDSINEVYYRQYIEELRNQIDTLNRLIK